MVSSPGRDAQWQEGPVFVEWEARKPRQSTTKGALLARRSARTYRRDQLMRQFAKTRCRMPIPKLPILVVAISVALVASSCGPTPQSLILGKWDAESALKVTAQFRRDGTAKLTMFGRTLQGTYKLNPENELEWTLNGRTTRAKVRVTANELELTDDANQTIKYRRE